MSVQLVDYDNLARQALREYGPMTLPDLLYALNQEFLQQREEPLKLLSILSLALESGRIEKQLILPTQMPTMFTYTEIEAIKKLSQQCLVSDQRYTFPELARLVKQEAQSPRSLQQMELKLKCIFMPLFDKDDTDGPDE